MKQPTRRHCVESLAEVTDHMADALAYLCRVARDANLDDISADLVLIRQRLLHSTLKTVHRPPDTPMSNIAPDRTTSER